MYTWNPTLLEDLINYIDTDITEMTTEELALWHYIRITPEKWQETEYGNKGGGFWQAGALV